MASSGRTPPARTASDGAIPTSNGAAHERVTEIQRARMLAAMTEAVCEHGAANVTVAHVVAGSGVSRRTFYEIFTNLEDCFLATFDEAVGRACAYVLPAYRSGNRWRERIRSGFTALLRFLDDEPFVGRLVVVDALAAGPSALQRRSRVLTQIVAAVDEGRGEARAGSGLPSLTAEGVAGAVLSVIHGRMLEGDGEPLVKLLNPLMSMIVLPYLGAAASRRELRRPAPSGSGRAKPAWRDPLAALELRLTYRTMRVLVAIASHPGSSNRMVADAAGVGDPGQISKLLARLRHLGFIENDGTGRARGEPNAWRLTSKGEEIEHAISARAGRPLTVPVARAST